METKFTAQKFIQTVLIDDCRRLIDHNHDYHSFVIITQGIETLGAFFDNKPFEGGKPHPRFMKGISLLGPKYEQIKKILWADLRCGLAHQLKPKGKIQLTSKQSGAQEIIHLYKGNISEAIYFVVDVYYEDFKKACLNVISILDDVSNTEIPLSKRAGIYLSVQDIELHIDPKTGIITENLKTTS